VPLKVKGLLEARFKQVAKKAGSGGMNMSINSSRGTVAKKDPLALTGSAAASAAKKRHSVAPGVNGGLMGLKFNKPKPEEKDASMNSSRKSSRSPSSRSGFNKSIEQTTKKMEKIELDEVQEEQKINFHGKPEVEDVEMVHQEDHQAIVINKSTASDSMQP